MPVAINAQDLEVIGSCELPETAKGISISGNYAYLTSRSYRLAIIDVEDPYEPYVLSCIDTLGGGSDISTQKNYAYISAWHPDQTLSIYDISDATNPELISTFATGSYGHHIFVRNSLVYLANCSRGLKLIDVSNAWNPTLLGVYDSLSWGETFGVFADNEYAYLIAWYDGLYIIDFSDPSNPAFIGKYETGTESRNAIISNGYAYIADAFSNLYIVDVSEPTNPILVTAFAQDQGTFDICLSNNYLFAAQWRKLAVIDVSVPASPVIIASHEFEFACRDVFCQNGYIYTSADRMFYIFNFSPTEVEEEIKQPSQLFASQNHPNPFNAATSIHYILPEQGEVTLTICNIRGQKVATLFDGMQEAGEHTITWDAAEFPSGVYFARLEAGEHSENIKMVLLK